MTLICLTLLTISQWINITFLTEFVDDINNKKSDIDNFENFHQSSELMKGFQQLQSLIIYMNFSKLLMFFLLPKRTSILIEMLIMGSTYLLFVMALYFLVKKPYFFFHFNIKK